MKVAFLGLGVMGSPMARHLAEAGHEVIVYNRTLEKTQAWIGQNRGQLARTPKEAAQGCSIVFSCVGNDEDLRNITLGAEGAFAGLAAGSLFVDHTTTSATVARELDRIAREQGVGFIDAPVSGGQIGAEKGLLTIMCGGDSEDFVRAEPVMRAYAQAVHLLGGAGSGQLAKMANQICIAGIVQALAEAIHFSKRAGLNEEAVIQAISKGAAQSWQMDNRAHTMAKNQFEFGFAVDWMRKDLNICLEEAHRNGAQLPLTALVDQFYRDVQSMGGGRWDTSSLIARLEQKPLQPSENQNFNAQLR